MLLALALAAVAADSSPAWPQMPAHGPKDGAYPLALLIRRYAETLDRPVLVDPRVRGQVRVFTAQPLTPEQWSAVFPSILETLGMAVVEEGRRLLVRPRSDVGLRPPRRSGEADPARARDTPVTRIFPLSRECGDDTKAQGTVLAALVSPHGRWALHPSTGMAVVTDVPANIERMVRILRWLDRCPKAPAPVVMGLENALAAEVALQVRQLITAHANGREKSPPLVAADPRTNTLVIMGDEPAVAQVRQWVTDLDRPRSAGSRQTRIRLLDHADARQVADHIEALMAGEDGLGLSGARVVPYLAGNALVVAADQWQHEMLTTLLDGLDRSRPMARIEAVIIAGDATEDLMLRFDSAAFWKSEAVNNGTLGGWVGALTEPRTISGIPAETFPAGMSLGLIQEPIRISDAQGNLVQVPSLSLLARALETDQRLRVVSRPQLLVLERTEARLQVVENRPFLVSETSAAQNGAYATYEYRDVGLQLKLVPENVHRQRIELRLWLELMEVNDSGTELSLRPTTSVRRMETVIALTPRETMVVAAMESPQRAHQTRQQPLLGRLPLLGWLGYGTDRQRRRQKFTVFVQAVPVLNP